MPSEPSPKRLLVVANENAGTARARAAEAVEVLRARGCLVDVVVADSPQATLSYVRSAHDVDGIVLGGGDGTLSLALPALLDAKRVPLGVLPLGTANDFARSIGIGDLRAACAAIVAGNVRAVDVGVAAGQPFLNAAALGLPAAVARELTGRLKKRLGMFASLAAAPAVARTPRRFDLEVRSDDRPLHMRSFAAMISVGRYVGGVPVSYDDLDDGLLYLTALRAHDLFAAFSLAISTLLRRLPEDANAIERRARAFEVRTAQVMDVSIDGDVRATTPLHVDVLPRALRVFAPATT
jgi:YegS/Rv2252/BmrU family lipid kinase